jgi:hypothetical protein
MRQPATPTEAARAADQWTQEVLECRTLQHAWQSRSASYSKRYRYYSRTLACTRCGTLKHQELDQEGYITASWYSYPKDYLSDLGRMTSQDNAVLRKASLDRSGILTTGAGSAPVKQATVKAVAK